MRILTILFTSLALLAASGAPPAFAAPPKQALITGVPFVSWEEAAKVRYAEKSITNPSIAAVEIMLMRYWAGDEAAAWMSNPKLDLAKKGWVLKNGTGLPLKELKAYLAKGIPVEIALPLTPYAHPLYKPAVAMIRAGVIKGVDIGTEQRASGILGLMIPLAKFRDISAKVKFNYIHESVIAAYSLAIGYDDTRHVFILHNPSFGPAFELSDAEFEEMWQAAEHRYELGYPKDAKPAGKGTAPYRARSPEELAAQDHAYGYALASIGRMPEAEALFRHGLAIPGLDHGHRYLLEIELAYTLYRQKRIDDAIASARDATQELPDEANGWRVLEYLYGTTNAPDAKLKAQMAATNASRKENLTSAKAAAKALPCDYLLLNVAQVRGWCGK